MRSLQRFFRNLFEKIFFKSKSDYLNLMMKAVHSISTLALDGNDLTAIVNRASHSCLFINKELLVALDGGKKISSIVYDQAETSFRSSVRVYNAHCSQHRG